MKIIATDFDGTLNYNGIGDKKREAIAAWRKNGNLFGIVTGRGFRSIFDVIKDTGIGYDFLVCNNGAVICDSKLNILTDTKCTEPLTKSLFSDLFSWDCPLVNVDKDVSFRVYPTAENGQYTTETMPNADGFNQISTYLATEEEAAGVVEKIKAKYGDALNPLQNGWCIDIVPKGVNKATGIYNLLKLVGGKYEDVIAVGDNLNDRDMIAEFRSYAMANGVLEIKKLADGIVYDFTTVIEVESK